MHDFSQGLESPPGGEQSVRDGLLFLGGYGHIPPCPGVGPESLGPHGQRRNRGSGRPAHQTKAVKDSIQTPEGDAKPKSGLGLEGGEGTGYPGGLRGRNR